MNASHESVLLAVRILAATLATTSAQGFRWARTHDAAMPVACRLINDGLKAAFQNEQAQQQASVGKTFNETVEQEEVGGVHAGPA